jgi:hypothetical protein
VSPDASFPHTRPGVSADGRLRSPVASQRRVSSPPRARVLVAAMLAAALGAAVVGSWLASGRDPAGKEGATLPASKLLPHVNDRGSFIFERLRSWRIVDRRRATEAIAPDQSAVVSISALSAQPLRRTRRALVADLNASYERFRTVGTHPEQVGGMPAIVVGGRAVNEAGTRLRVLAIAVAGEDRNYGITVFVVHGDDTALPGVDAILRSFRSIP